MESICATINMVIVTKSKFDKKKLRPSRIRDMKMKNRIIVFLIAVASLGMICSCNNQYVINTIHIINTSYGSLSGKYDVDKNHLEFTVKANLISVTSSDTSYICYDDVQLLEFVGTQGETSYNTDVIPGEHRVICYTQGKNDTLVFCFPNSLFE